PHLGPTETSFKEGTLKCIRTSMRARPGLSRWPALLAICLLAAACGSTASSGSSGSSASGSSSGSKSASGSYTVGFTPSLSGAYAALGAQELLFARAVFDQVNAAGGINGHQIVVTTADAGPTDAA